MALATHSHQSHARAGPAAPGPSGAGAAGTAAGVSASLIWGSAFLVPVLLGGWNPVIVTLGRYLVYGLLSAILFTLGGAGPRRVLREHWRTALAFALAGNAAYYLLLVIGVRAAGAPLTDMVIGAIPVVVAVAGNVLIPAADAVPWWRLALPLTLVIAGLVLVGALEIAGVHAYLAVPPAEKAAGLLAACAAVVLWTWYALANARFLARQRAVSPAAWSTAVGVATGAVALAGLPVAALAGQLTTPPGAHPGPARLVAGVVFLGVVVSWAGTWLWNLASSRLSPVVAGLLVNLETVSGFGYVYAARQQWPAAGQLTGLALVLAGVTLTLALTRRREPFRLTSLLICYVRPMLHGRSAETARIDELLAAARDGRSGALVIRGEAGVGKTALLDYAAAAAGMRVLRGTGIESEAELPFAALQLLLRPGLGRLDLLPPPQAQALRGAFGLAGTPGADRFLIGLAALSLLSELAGDGALLCVVDDAHWLDRASADALLFAARRLESEGVVLLDLRP